VPTATPALSIVGKLVEAPLPTPPGKTQIARPKLANEIVFLCLKIQNKCTTHKSLSVKTDDAGGFVFDSLPAGEYVILYAAFLNGKEGPKSVDNFWAFWDGRELDFSNLDSFIASFINPANTAFDPQFFSDRGFGSLSKISQQPGGMAKTGICYLPENMGIEFVGDMVPLTVTVKPGQTVQITVEAHAGLAIVLF